MVYNKKSLIFLSENLIQKFCYLKQQEIHGPGGGRINGMWSLLIETHLQVNKAFNMTWIWSTLVISLKAFV